jgi:hypothetical protein
LFGDELFCLLDFGEELRYGFIVLDVDFADGACGTAEAGACGLPSCFVEGFEHLSS